jgi:hypothetical protein
MLNLSNFQTVRRNIFVGWAVGLLTLTSFVSPSLSKPSNWSYKLGDLVQFNFWGCAQSVEGDKVICTGNFRSRSGEQRISVGPGSQSNPYVIITDSRGNTYLADEMRIGDEWSCRTNCGTAQFDLVEGIDYKTVFIFKDVSLPSSKLALFYFSGSARDRFELRIRNIKMSESRQ